MTVWSREQAPALRDQHDAAGDDAVRGLGRELLAAQPDAALDRPQNSRKRL